MLASSHLTLNPKPSSLLSSTDNHSLGALASSTPMLSSLGSSGSDNMPSLGLLASNHLSSGKPDSNLGENVLGVKCVSPIQSDINLLSALKLSSEEEIKPKEELVIRKQEEDVPNIDIFVSKRTFGKMKSILRMRGKTPFALPLTRKWARKTPVQPKTSLQEIYLNKDRFRFDTPSPDDIVMQAQHQSRAFNRLNIAK